jgi:hypothetical protein
VFKKPFNIHVIPEHSCVHIAFRVSPNFVINHVFDMREFVKVTLQYSDNKRKIVWNNKGAIWELNFKKEYVKLFYKTKISDYHFRYSHEDIKELFIEFKKKLAQQREK